MSDVECSFCQILEGRLEAQIVYQDERTLAFMDTSPVQTRHALVIPRVCQPDFYKLAEADYQATMHTARKVAQVLQTLPNPRKVGAAIQGFETPHTHVHLIPMNTPDDLCAKPQPEKTQAELAPIAERLRSALQGG